MQARFQQMTDAELDAAIAARRALLLAEMAAGGMAQRAMTTLAARLEDAGPGGGRAAGRDRARKGGRRDRARPARSAGRENQTRPRHGFSSVGKPKPKAAPRRHASRRCANDRCDKPFTGRAAAEILHPAIAPARHGSESGAASPRPLSKGRARRLRAPGPDPAHRVVTLGSALAAPRACARRARAILLPAKARLKYPGMVQDGRCDNETTERPRVAADRLATRAFVAAGLRGLPPETIEKRLARSRFGLCRPDPQDPGRRAPIAPKSPCARRWARARSCRV